MFKKLEVPFLKEFKDIELEAFTDESWGSTVPGYRENLRAALQQRITTQWNKDVLPPEIQAVANLAVIPRFRKIFVSISHSVSVGGFAIARRPLGFDIEVSERVRRQLAERISAPQEILIAPSPAHLWTAKEATYKALFYYQQPKVIADVLVGDWHDQSFVLLNDKIFKAPVGRGAAWEKDQTMFAVYCFC